MSKIERARERASQLPYEKGQHRVWSAIYDKRGRLLSEAGNDYKKSSPVMARYADAVQEPFKQYWHSECLALHRLPKDSKPYRIVIARVGKAGGLLPSAPCKICLNAIKERKIKVLEYFV